MAVNGGADKKSFFANAKKIFYISFPCLLNFASLSLKDTSPRAAQHF